MMQDKLRYQITSKQLIFIIVGSMIGTGVFDLPREISAAAGPDAWIATILGALVPLLSLFLIGHLGSRFPGLTVVEQSRLLFGRIIGSILAGGFVVYVILIESIVLRRFNEITSIFLLPSTPIWVISLLTTLVVIYIVTRGIKVIGRLNEFLFYLLLLLLVVLLPPLARIDANNILPVGGAGLLPILKGALAALLVYSGTEVLFVLYPMVERKDEVLKAGFIGVGLVVVFYLFITVICLLVFGSEVMQHLMWPGLRLLKVVDIPVFERMEFFFTILWIGLGPRPMINLLFAASYSLLQLLYLDLHKHYRLVVLIVGLTIFAGSLFPKNILQTFKWGEIIGRCYLVVGIFYPLLFLIAVFLRGGKVSDEQ
jgi:spore germination protein